MSREWMALEGRVYVEGSQDCYGLLRAYCKKMYDMDLRNYARPCNFAWQGVNVIKDNLLDSGFEYVNASLGSLEVGDVLTMALLRSTMPNHLAIYVGNNLILHHLQNGRSLSEDFSKTWRNRVLNVVRHPRITDRNGMRPNGYYTLAPHAQPR